MAPLTFTRTGHAGIDKWLSEAADYLPRISPEQRLKWLAMQLDQLRRPKMGPGETAFHRSQAISALERWANDFEIERATADAGLLPVGDYVMRG